MKSLAIAVTLAFVTSAAAAEGPPGPAPHLRALASTLAPHLGSRDARIEVVELAAPSVRQVSGSIEVSTGLLALLENDAQLAMVLGYELARATPSEPPRREGKGARSTVGATAARAAAAGAAAGAVGYAIHDALSSSAPIVRGAVVGGATAAAATAVHAGMARRGDGPASRQDDEAATAGMRALVAAGYDGREALEAWDRIAEGAPRGGEPGGYADAGAQRERRAAAAKALRKSGPAPTGRSGHHVGGASYREGVLARLDGWRLASPARAAGDARGSDAPASSSWLRYRRSGGITGWSAELEVTADGRVTASESNRRELAGPRERLGAEGLVELQRLVARAAAAPARQIRPESRHLRDGVARSVDVRDGGTESTIDLSDGRDLLPTDHELVRALESLLR